VIDTLFWKNKKIFLTGHTGFKGSWLCLWLHSLGARVYGYALQPPTEPSLFNLCELDKVIDSTIADVRDRKSLHEAMISAQPEIVIHMAAQPLVRDSYKIPVDTYDINVMGTVNLFETVRACPSVHAVINVTTDKCYENREWVWGYREHEALGGYDPYSNSKACSELVTAAYRSSYFNLKEYAAHRVGIATARSGNVIGGGDWATDRLVPDCVRSILKGDPVLIRNPNAIRPWQHVLEPLSGYLILAQKLIQDGPRYSGAWNFGPGDDDARPVGWLVKQLCSQWGDTASFAMDKGVHPHEAHYLKLDCSKAKAELGWKPRWKLEKAIESIVAWTKGYQKSREGKKACLQQIEEYSALLTKG
jgi:CDP-glucose 4,6-dehydratase